MFDLVIYWNIYFVMYKNKAKVFYGVLNKSKKSIKAKFLGFSLIGSVMRCFFFGNEKKSDECN